MLLLQAKPCNFITGRVDCAVVTKKLATKKLITKSSTANVAGSERTNIIDIVYLTIMSYLQATVHKVALI
jgi:hypothetical protein